MKKEIIILSGFLGTGKTTILQNLIMASHDKKIAILLNDFGDIVVDGALIEGEKGTAPLVEIGGGSVFCSCLKEAFVKALLSLSVGDSERILVEASGMSDPSGVTKMLELAGLDKFYDNVFIICLFDPQRSLKLAKVLEVIPRQVKASHLVILTKSDITTEEERKASVDYIRSINQDVPIVESYNGVFELENAPKLESVPSAMSLMSFNTPETRLDSFVITKPVKDLEKLINILEASDILLRVKGSVKTEKGNFFVTDSPTGIVAKESQITVPLTIICMQGKGKVLQEQIEVLL